MVAPIPPVSAAGGRFRQRKISTKQTLQILKQSQLSDVDNDDLQQRDMQEIETGVDKNEEDEEHLQKILKKSGISSTSEEYIPTPDASKVWGEAKKFYTGTFNEPESYIKSSCQVEDYAGCLYNMDEQDEEFLKELNKSRKKSKDKLTEDEFESIMYAFEDYINQKQPFLIIDPTQLLPLEEIKEGLTVVDKSSVDNIRKSLADELGIHSFITNLDPKEIAQNPTRPLNELLEKYGDEIYKHFRSRKITRHGKSIHPTLKFNQEDDNDPYSCFRQRQFRQQRKTRRADIQSSEKLIKLFYELKATRELTFMVAEREKKRLLSLQTEREIFELRCKVKKMKRELGIKDSDEDLVAHKKKKVVPPPPQQIVQDDKKDDLVNQKKDKKVLSKLGNNANIQDKPSSKQVAVIGDDSAGSEQQLQQQQLQPQPQQQAFQPYVKLPPSKIPDLELESVSQLLKAKDTKVQDYVEERLKKRKQADDGFVNLTDDPYSPYLDLSLQNQSIVDSSHIPYSSISSSLFDVQSYSYIFNMENYIDKGDTPTPNDTLLFNLGNREVISKHNPEIYNPFYSDRVLTSEPKYTIRKRVGRYGQVFIDRKFMVKKPYDVDEVEDEDFDADGDIEMLDRKARFEDRWKYDADDGILDIDRPTFSDDPARLNKISNETQVIRFGGMLLTKAYESVRDSYVQHKNMLYKQYQKQQQQKKQLEAQAANGDGQAKGEKVNTGSSSTTNGTQPRKSQSPMPQAPRTGNSLINNNNGSTHKANSQVKTES